VGEVVGLLTTFISMYKLKEHCPCGNFLQKLFDDKIQIRKDEGK
jgi:hypothetical protein